MGLAGGLATNGQIGGGGVPATGNVSVATDGSVWRFGINNFGGVQIGDTGAIQFTEKGGALWLVGSGLDISTAGSGLLVKEGSNCKQGTAVLVAGAVTVANTSVTATSRIFLTSQADGGTPGFLRVSARVAGTSFTITSSSGTDTSTVAFEIFEAG